MAYLTLLLDSREVRKFVLQQPGVTTIGRAQDNDIVINNLALSRRHAQVEASGSTFTLVDLGSQNGVFINGERVRGRKALSDNDSVALGTYSFVFRMDRPVAADDSETTQKRQRKARVHSERTALVSATEPKEDPSERVPLLVLKYNDVELQRQPLRGKQCTIGRAKECDVQIAERRLSRKHCEIYSTDGTRFLLKDLGSQNGTYVNRRRIRGFYELRHRDVLNFAEYSVLFLADVHDYRGPDAAGSSSPEETIQPPSVVPDAKLEVAETVMPPAYSEQYGYEDPDRGFLRGARPTDSAIRPSDLDEDPDDPRRRPRPPLAMSPGRDHANRTVDPIIRSPKEARNRRSPPAPEPKVEVRPAVSEAPPPKPAPTQGKKRKRKLRPSRAPSPREPLAPDVPDAVGVAQPDHALDDWYAGREEHSRLYDPIEEEQQAPEESMLIPPESGSQVSRVLGTMMVDKRELERNLRGKKARERRFSVQVLHGSKEIYSGPLSAQVTILGTDREADIRLRGRYVAGRHSLLVKVRDSLLLVRLGSSSAARVNGLPKLQAFLKNGDVIQIDETTIKVSSE